MHGQWSTPQTIPPLRPGEIQVWRIRTSDEFVDRAHSVLTPDERDRAARMRLGRAREEFIVGRGCLRTLLGAALQIEPRNITLELGPHGKPQLARRTGISFNVAHSHGVVLIALALGCEVGVDVEYVDPSIEALDIARSTFHPADVARLERAASQDDLIAEFYRCWTRKEAVAKADGRGLSLDLAAFATAGNGNGEQVIDLADGSSGRQSRYFVHGLEISSSHMAALATPAPINSLILFDLDRILRG